MNKEDPNEDWCAVCSDGGEVKNIYCLKLKGYEDEYRRIQQSVVKNNRTIVA